MTVLTLKLEDKIGTIIKKIDQETLTFLVGKVVKEYFEELQDIELAKQINESKEIDFLLNKIKF